MAARGRELWEAYPRIVKGMVVGIVLLLSMDVVLAGKRVQYSLDFTRMRAAMTETERGRVDALASELENNVGLAAELARRQGLGDAGLHLVVDSSRGLLSLQHHGARLREMRVLLGPEATVGTPPDVVLLVPPLGKRSVARVVDASYAWAVPTWVYLDRQWPVPADRRMAGALGPLAIILDSGAVLYSRPAVGPLNDAAYVLPGSIRVEAPDFAAIRENLQPGTAVYFH